MSTPEPSKRTCFFICPIGENSSPERERSDLILDCLLTPVLDPLGFAPILRADQMPEPGMITNQIIQQLLSCDLVVADLEGSNANVFYELAIRHAARKPSIHLFLPGQKIPFDLAGSRAIPVDSTNVRAFEDSKKVLAEQVAQTLKDGDNAVDSPFATALAVISMSTTGSSVEKMLAHVVNTQGEILGLLQNQTLIEKDLASKWLANVDRQRKSRVFHSLLGSENKFQSLTKQAEIVVLVQDLESKLKTLVVDSPEHEETTAVLKRLREAYGLF